MFHTHRVAVAALILFAASSLAHAQSAPATAPTIKIGYVNTQALMQVAPGRLSAESTYNKEAAAFGLQQKKWTDSLSKLVDEYKKAAPKMTDAQKQAKEQSIAT